MCLITDTKRGIYFNKEEGLSYVIITDEDEMLDCGNIGSPVTHRSSVLRVMSLRE